VWSDPLHCFRPVIYNENRNSNVSRRQRAVRRTVFVDARIDASQQPLPTTSQHACAAAAAPRALRHAYEQCLHPNSGPAIGTRVSCLEHVGHMANFASFFCEIRRLGWNY